MGLSNIVNLLTCEVHSKDSHIMYSPSQKYFHLEAKTFQEQMGKQAEVQTSIFYLLKGAKGSFASMMLVALASLVTKAAGRHVRFWLLGFWTPTQYNML